MVTYYGGIKIDSSADINCDMIIHDVEGHFIIGSVNDSKPYSYSGKYEEKLLNNENVLKPLNNKEKEKEEWNISWDTGKESQDSIIGW